MVAEVVSAHQALVQEGEAAVDRTVRDSGDAMRDLACHMRDVDQYFRQAEEADWGSRAWRGRLWNLTDAVTELNKFLQDWSDELAAEDAAIKVAVEGRLVGSRIVAPWE